MKRYSIWSVTRARRVARRTARLLAVTLWVLSALAIASAQSADEQQADPTKKDEASSQQTDSAKKETSTEQSKSAKNQTSQQSNSVKSQNSTQTKDAAQQKDKRGGEFVIAPIPINSPALGAGLQFVVGYVTPLNKEDTVSPPSMFGLGGLVTNNGSRGLALGTRLYMKEDKYRFTIAAGKASINARLYGEGRRAGDSGIFLPLNTKGGGLIAEALFRFKKGMYLGARFQYRNLRLSIDRDNSDLPPDTEINPPPTLAPIIELIGEELFRHRTVSIGPRFQWDTRDNTLYPRKGFFLDSGIDFFTEGLGSKFTYQYYKVGFNKYIGFRPNQVIAFRVMGCGASGDHVPIYDLCLFGAFNDIRGYSAGRYQDRRMFATQGEYRFTIPKTGFLGRFGLVGFAGFGAVGPKFTDIGGGDLLPGGGAGVRFRLTKTNPINFRVDYGFGKHGGTLSIGVLEAF